MRRAFKLRDEAPLFQCESNISDRNSIIGRKMRGKELRCERLARYVVDGRKLCGNHAGSLALKILTSEQ